MAPRHLGGLLAVVCGLSSVAGAQQRPAVPFSPIAVRAIPPAQIGTLTDRAGWAARVRAGWRDSLALLTARADSVRGVAPGTVPMTGDPSAPLVVEVWEDFQCPYCAQQEGFAKAAIMEYERRGLVRTVHYDLPIQGHRNAWDASVYALCLAPHGKYAEARTLLFQSQAQWGELEDPRAVFRSMAQRLNAPVAQVMKCYEDGAPLPVAQYGVSQAIRRHVNATPTFAVAERSVVGGAGSAAGFAVLLDEMLLGAAPKPSTAPSWKRAVTAPK